MSEATGASEKTGAASAAAHTVETNGDGAPLLEVHNLKMHFPITKGIIFQRQVAATHNFAAINSYYHISIGSTIEFNDVITAVVQIW